jgi:hypothetical protein
MPPNPPSLDASAVPTRTRDRGRCQCLNGQVTAFGHNVRHARPKHPNVAPGGSGENRLRPDRRTSRISRRAARAHPDMQRTGPQHPRDHLRDGNPDDARGSVVHRVLALLPVTRAGPIIAALVAALLSSSLSGSSCAAHGGLHDLGNRTQSNAFRRAVCYYFTFVISRSNPERLP